MKWNKSRRKSPLNLIPGTSRFIKILASRPDGYRDRDRHWDSIRYVFVNLGP